MKEILKTMKMFKSYGNDVKIPSMEECKDLLKRYNTPKHVINHCIGVMEFATKLAEKINANSENNNGLVVNIDMIKRVCLVHDILRVVDFEELDRSSFIQDVSDEDLRIWKEQQERYKKDKFANGNHAYAARDVFKEDYPEFADCIRKHDYVELDSADGDWCLEDFIVTYSDKRVRDHGPIPLRERFGNGHDRFDKKMKKLGATEEQLKELYESKERIDHKFFELEADLLELAGVERL